MMCIKILQLIIGYSLGLLFAYIIIDGLTSPDPIQQKVSKKAQCKTYQEILSSLNNPEERYQFVVKHEKILQKCEEEKR
ncbi:MAG: hypothetical protein QW228_07510 [Candidatus Aenigmatarchaeota archaeon]